MVNAATTNELSGILQRGLFEEEANHNLDAAIEAYQGVVTQYDKDRKLAATAIFRLGECYRKQNKLSEARAQYQRVIRDFSDQSILVEMCQKAVGARSGVSPLPVASTNGLEVIVDNRQAEFTGQWLMNQGAVDKYGPDYQFSAFSGTPQGFEGAPAKETVSQLKKQISETTATFRPNLPVAGAYDVQVWHTRGENRATNAPWLIVFAGGEETVFVNQRTNGGKWLTIAKNKMFRAGTNGYARLSGKTGATAPAGIVVVADAVRFVRSGSEVGVETTDTRVKQLTELENLRMQTMSDAKETEMILQKLSELPLKNIRTVLPTLLHDQQLEGMLQKIAQSEVDLAAMKINLGKEHPDIKREEAVLKVLNEQVDSKVEALMTAMRVRLASAQAKLKDLNDQNRSSNVRTAFTQKVSAGVSKTTNAPMTDAEEQEIRRIQALVKDSPDLINAPGQNGTFMHQAVRDGRLNMVRFLLESGAEVDPRDNGGMTPLHMAALYGHKAIAELLLEHHATVNAQTKEWNKTPLHLATEKRYKTVVDALVNHGADVNLQNSLGETPLLLGVASRAIVEALLAKNANVNLRSKQGYSPLHGAVHNPEVVKMLLARGADVNAVAQDGPTALHAAVFAGNIPSAELLLNAHAEINKTNNAGETPVYQAALRGDREMVEYLLAKNADPSLKDRYGRTPLFVASAKGFLDVLQLLLSHNADPNEIMSDRWSPLHVASNNGRKEIVENLLKHGVSINPLAQKDMTPLDVAMGAARNACDNNPIHFPDSSRYRTDPFSFQDIVAILKAHGAKIGQDVLRTNYIFWGRNQQFFPLLEKGTNNHNQLTLLEFCGLVNWSSLPFPDLKHVTIARFDSVSGKEATIDVDLESVLASRDCSDVQWLQWGDKVLIPEKDHPVTQSWLGLPTEQAEFIAKCNTRKVTLRVKGEDYRLHLGTFADKIRSIVTGAAAEAGEKKKSGLEKVVVINDAKFFLSNILTRSELLRSSSDTTKVKLKRVDPTTEQAVEWITNPFSSKNDFWVREGDVIEVPEKQ